MKAKQRKTKMRLPVLTALLLLGIFALGSVAGMFMYATGSAVVDNPKMAMVSKTEYRYGEEGQIIARLVDFQGNPVTVTNCTATIIYPDKTMFVNASLMSTSTISGDHYFNFTTPSGPEGVYEYQALCNYGPGGIFSQAVTNSYHLSSAFSSVFGNLTQIQDDLSNLSTDLSSINQSLSLAIADLNDTMTLEFSTIQANFTQVLDAVAAINVSVNFTDVINNITAVNDNVNNLSVQLTNSFACTPNSTVCDLLYESIALVNSTFNDMNASLTTVLANQDQLLAVQINQTALLEGINITTTNTYEYMTGTLANNIDDVLTNLGIINATVNRIETATLQINTTVTDILTNQENEVQMRTFSG